MKRLLILTLWFVLCWGTVVSGEPSDPVLQKIERLRIQYQNGQFNTALETLRELNVLLKSCQSPLTFESKLPSAIDTLNSIMFGSTVWGADYYITGGSQDWLAKQRYLRNADVVNALGAYRSDLISDTMIRTPDGMQAELVLKHRDALGLLFSELDYIGNDACYFMRCSIRGLSIPIKFFQQNDKTGILVDGFSTDDVYNKIRTTSNQRAALTFTRVITPVLHYFDQALYQSDLDYYGIVVYYGCGDFANLEDSVDGEALAVLLKKEDCHRFVRGEITETELLDNAEVFLNDVSMGTSGFKKVTIRIE